jgi:glyoxylase-like metal-dependent hydrolase (beta-lactamase superfamily II)
MSTTTAKALAPLARGRKCVRLMPTFRGRSEFGATARFVPAYELAPRLWTWSAPHPEWSPEKGGVGGWEREVGSWLLDEAGQVILIDPLLPEDPGTLEWLERLVGGRSVDVLITVHWHLRSAQLIRDRYQATVWGNAKTREDVEELVTGVVEDGSVLPGGVLPFAPIPDTAGEDETAYWLPRQRALAVGDILIQTPEGPRIWWEQTTEERRTAFHDAALPALHRLLGLPIELILLPHGAPITQHARQAFEQALEAPTWQRP